MNTAFLCTGQGSQYVGMLKELLDKYANIADLVNECDEILGYPLSNICFEGPIDRLKETRYTQPALFIHSAVLYSLIKNHIQVDAVAGHSVGEYAALYIAGALELEDALNLVSLRGQLMYSIGSEIEGTMFAVIGLEDEKVIKICEELNKDGNIVVPANFNAPGQIVVSGSAEYLRQNVNVFKEAGARMVKELVVSGAFHSPLMETAQQQLTAAIDATNFVDAKLPIYSNVYAKPLTKAEDLRDALTKQLTSPVQWKQLIVNMHQDGINKFIELGPGKVLQGLVKRIVDDVEVLGVDTAEDVEGILKNESAK